MSITFPTATKNSRADIIVDSIDLGTTNATGKLRLKDSSNNTLTEHLMSNPAFGAASGGAAIANSIGDGTGLIAGQAVTFDLVDRDEVLIFSGTVGAVGSGADLESTTSSTAIAISENVPITSLTYVEVS